MHVRRICSDLVAIRSENPPGTTDDAVEYIRNFLSGIGAPSEVCGNGNGFANLVSAREGARLLFCGHVDVVPALPDGWTHPPFSGLINDTFVWGRGSTDMKGGCAAILAACRDLADAGTEIPASLAFVCDEETGGENGIRYLLTHRKITPCDCLIAEPTPSHHPSIGQKGLCRISLVFKGTPAHGSLYPVVGMSAIMEAMSFLEYMKTLHNRVFPVDPVMKNILEQSSGVLEQEFQISGIRDVLTRLTYNPGVIRGGEKSNVVAQHCELDLEMRVPFGCSIPDLLADIRAHAPHARVTVNETHVPSSTDPASPLVTVACGEVERVRGGPVFPIVQWAASDARHLRREGFRVIEYGPGEISTLHAVNERVRIDGLEKAVDVYRGIMQKYS
ncbi:M20/M25/M40 family metallo-hydrolase [Methanoregula sp.]|uniref:M20/M25/M40 family metallo-hydrolase n=1 Tax=Methanoregula sp. TaxID=2052170 RepID=UPI003C77E0B5